MQDHDWNDLKFLLALQRTGTLAAAARVLGVNETTVARRLRALQRSLKVVLFVRGRAGRYEATEAGLAAIARAERVENENISLSEMAGSFNARLFGTVRITSVAMIINRVLVPRLAALRAAHPALTVELVADARNLSLGKREADLALRLARPQAGGSHTKARKIGELVFAAYCPAAIPEENCGSLDWIGYDDTHAHLPQAQWLAAAGAGTGSDFPCLRVADAETAHEAVAAGLGRTILPRIVADTDCRLRRASTNTVLPTREVWLLSYDDQGVRRSVDVAKTWLTAIDWALWR